MKRNRDIVLGIHVRRDSQRIDKENKIANQRNDRQGW